MPFCRTSLPTSFHTSKREHEAVNRIEREKEERRSKVGAGADIRSQQTAEVSDARYVALSNRRMWSVYIARMDLANAIAAAKAVYNPDKAEGEMHYPRDFALMRRG
jgi:hypothetical protein